MIEIFANNASSSLAGAITDSATSIAINDASSFPAISGSDFYYCTIDDGTYLEIVKVVARVGTLLTVERAQQGTTARVFQGGSEFEMRLTSDGLKQLQQPFGYVFVNNYGAKANGVDDDAAAIQAAIDALPASGGKVIFGPGTYVIASTINVGDGTSLLKSTKHAVSLIGAGTGYPQDFQTVPSALSGATILKWAGAAGGTMVEFKGPIGGPGMEGFLLRCASLANTAIKFTHTFLGRFQDIIAVNYMGVAFDLGCHLSHPLMNVGGDKNIYDRVIAAQPGQASSGGIRIGESTAGTWNNANNSFRDCSFRAGSSGTALHLRNTDSNCFYDTGTSPVSGIGLKLEVPSGITTMPCGNTFYGCSIAGVVPISQVGTMDYQSKNVFLPWDTTNGEPIPAVSANLFGVTTSGKLFGNWAFNDPFSPPKLTTTQRDALASPQEGWIIWNTTTHVLNHYNGSAWAAV